MYYLFFSHTQILTIFRQNTCFSKCQFSGPLWSIWTYNTNFLLKIEWGLWKNMFFSILSPKRGCFGGINRFDPHHFWTDFMQKKIQGLFTGPSGPNPKFWDVHFFRNYISFPTIYNTWGFGWIWGQSRQNKKFNFLENFTRKLVALRRIAIWDQTVARIKKK